MRRYDENNFDEHENLHGCNNDEVAMFEAFWAEELEGRKEARKTGGKLFLAVAIALIVTFVGAPLLGAGLGFGSQIATNYVLPRLLNDSAQRESFAFDNVHTPLTSANLQNPLVYRGDYVALVEAVKPSVVTLSVVMQADVSFSAGQTRARAGTGILFYETASRYYVATNAHVIAGGAAVYASIEGSAPIAAVPIGRNDLEDLAVIAIYKSDAVRAGVNSVVLASFGDSRQARVGEIVVAIGNAMGEGIAVTNGIVSARDVEIFVEGIWLEVIQTNAAINRGNSGGPLVNVWGEVIGINTAKYSEQLAEAMGYAIPSHVAKPILEQIMRDGPEAPRPRIGVNIDNWTPRDAQTYTSMLMRRGLRQSELIIPQYGVFVTSVAYNSPAYLAGMLRNDIIVSIGGNPISNSEGLVTDMTQRSEGDIVTFTVIRGGIERINITITLGSAAQQQTF